MQGIVHRWASILGLGAGLLAGVILLLGGAGFWTLVQRAAVAAGTIFLFVHLGGQLVLQSLLRSLAEADLRRQADEAASAEAAAAESGEGSDEAPLAARAA